MSRDWDSFFRDSCGNKWPDIDIVSHASRVISSGLQPDIFIDIGCGSGANTRFGASVAKSVYCLDISEHALKRLSYMEPSADKKSIIAKQADLTLPFDWHEFLGRDRKCQKIYVDCTCLQHIPVPRQLERIKEIQEFEAMQGSTGSALITKSLIYQSKGNDFDTYIEAEGKRESRIRLLGNIIDKTYTTIDNGGLVQRYCTYSVIIGSS